jgi:hypothetical protein
MAALTPEQVNDVLAQANLQLFTRNLLTSFRVEHPYMPDALETDVSTFLTSEEQVELATIMARLSLHLRQHLEAIE